MNIGNRHYKIESSDSWVVYRESYFPPVSVILEIYTTSTNTYWIIPIELLNHQDILQNNLSTNFEMGEIIDVDTTLEENGKSHNIWHQKLEFKASDFFNFTNLEIQGITETEEPVHAKITTRINGFEIWKTKNHQKMVLDIEQKLKQLSIPFETIDESENELIRIKLETKPNNT